MLNIYCDGACSGNPGPGSWAVVVVENDIVVDQYSGFDNYTTNNKMELMAAIQAISKYKKCNIYLDSKYVKDGITLWINNWKKNSWKTSEKKDVKNKELWLQLDQNNNIDINWYWIKGHDNNIHDLAHNLAEKTLKEFIS